MTTFDKVCACVAIPIGALFLLLGVVGLFMGCSARFTLPPGLGVLPFFLGWAMTVPLIRAWRQSTRDVRNRRRDEPRLFDGRRDPYD